MKERPKIKIQRTSSDKILEASGYVLLVTFWIMNILSYNQLPAEIPIHFNGLGEVDQTGNKISIFALPVIGTLVFIVLTLFNRHPENFNYRVEIDAENTEQQYRNSTKMVRLLKIIVLFIFMLIDYFTIQTSVGNSAGLGKWFLPCVVALILIPIAYFSYKSYRLKK